MSPAILQTAKQVKVHLLPGDFYFSDENNIITTVLGSCISIAIWHPLLHIGGMSHSILPSRGKGKPGKHKLDGCYIDNAIELLLREIGKHHTHPADYQVKLFGGGNMFKQPHAESALNIGASNIHAARKLLEVSGFIVHAEHVGGSGHRRIIFDMRDGSVLVKHEKL